MESIQEGSCYGVNRGGKGLYMVSIPEGSGYGVNTRNGNAVNTGGLVMQNNEAQLHGSNAP